MIASSNLDSANPDISPGSATQRSPRSVFLDQHFRKCRLRYGCLVEGVHAWVMLCHQGFPSTLQLNHMLLSSATLVWLLDILSHWIVEQGALYDHKVGQSTKTYASKPLLRSKSVSCNQVSTVIPPTRVLSSWRHFEPALKMMTVDMLTRQAVHMTLPVPEQKGQVSSPPFLAVVWATLTGTLPSPAQLPHVK